MSPTGCPKAAPSTTAWTRDHLRLSRGGRGDPRQHAACGVRGALSGGVHTFLRTAHLSSSLRCVHVWRHRTPCPCPMIHRMIRVACLHTSMSRPCRTMSPVLSLTSMSPMCACQSIVYSHTHGTLMVKPHKVMYMHMLL